MTVGSILGYVEICPVPVVSVAIVKRPGSMYSIESGSCGSVTSTRPEAT